MQRTKNTIGKKYLIFFFLLSGLIYRIWFFLHFPQPVVYDQTEYLRYAAGLRQDIWYSETARLYGYPLILNAVFFLSGYSFQNVFVFQAILDTLTAFLIFRLAQYIFDRKTAFLAMIL